MNPRIGLFLDTSILYSLRLKQPVLCGHIQEVCRPSHVFTGASAYSLFEFEQHVLRDADYLCGTIENRGYDAAKEWVNNGLPPQQGRKRTTCHSIFALMDSQWRDNASRLARIGARQFPDMKEWAVDWLKRFRATELDVLRKFVNHWNDEIDCCSMREVESRRRKGEKCKVVKCSSADCRLSEFLEKNRENLQKISKTLQTLSEKEKTDELEKIAQFIHEWEKDPGQIFKRENGCRLVGDLLIALESGSFDIIYTQNYKEFIPLGKALGKNIWNQPNKAETPSIHRFHTAME